MAVHLSIGGSTAERTLACPAWVSRSKPIPRSPSSSYAVEGSMLHEVMEQCRLEGLKPQDILDRGFTYKDDEGHELSFTEDTLDLAEIAYNVLEAHLDDLDIDQFDIEPFVEIIPGTVGGSIDYLGLSTDGKTVLVADYKFGKKGVSARENAQLLFYALGAKTDPKTAHYFKDAENVAITVIQPKVKGVRSSWTAPISVLDEFGSKLSVAINDAESAKPTALSGSHCHWCPFSPYCKEKKGQMLAAMTLSADNAESLEDALIVADEAIAWANNVKTEGHRMLERGVNIRGWKLVGKKAVNKWKDEDGAQTELEGFCDDKDIYKTTKKFITAPQALTLIKKINKRVECKYSIDHLIAKIAPEGTTLASEDDPREAIVVVTENTANLKEMFK